MRQRSNAPGPLDVRQRGTLCGRAHRRSSGLVNGSPLSRRSAVVLVRAQIGTRTTFRPVAQADVDMRAAFLADGHNVPERLSNCGTI